MPELEILGDMPEPRFMQEGYEYLDEDGQPRIRDDAPEWAKKEFKEFYAMVNPVADEEGLVIQG